jgi:hypothetical protein
MSPLSPLILRIRKNLYKTCDRKARIRLVLPEDRPRATYHAIVTLNSSDFQCNPACGPVKGVTSSPASFGRTARTALIGTCVVSRPLFYLEGQSQKYSDSEKRQRFHCSDEENIRGSTGRLNNMSGDKNCTS